MFVFDLGYSCKACITACYKACTNPRNNCKIKQRSKCNAKSYSQTKLMSALSMKIKALKGSTFKCNERQSWYDKKWLTIMWTIGMKKITTPLTKFQWCLYRISNWKYNSNQISSLWMSSSDPNIVLRSSSIVDGQNYCISHGLAGDGFDWKKAGSKNG